MILIQNDQQALPCTQDLLAFCRWVLTRAMIMLRVPLHAEVSVALVDNDAMRALNRQYRGIDKPTDVLSFSQLEGEELFDVPDVLILGDIVISIEQALAQAESYGHSFKRELAFLLVHGLLHLVGYEHDDEFVGPMHDRQLEIMQALAFNTD
ncbi:MAG: rRNA maturation RNase YbeY [Firmicutes bacterium]|nr:rRNA maturation RNase YbeY [Bacillota bacterium]